MYMRIVSQVVCAFAICIFFYQSSKAAPVIYEIGGRFTGYGDPNLVAAFEGAPYTFRFTLDSNNIQNNFISGNELATYTNAYSNFEFSTTVNGVPYNFTIPDTNKGTLIIANNVPAGYAPLLQDAAVFLSSAELDGQNIPLVDPDLEIGGYFPCMISLIFGSYLDLNGNNGLDFITSLEPDIDPVTLNNSFNFGPYSGYEEVIGSTVKVVRLSFLSKEGGPIIDEFGHILFPEIYTEFSYIRIVDNDVSSIDTPTPLVLSIIGFSIAAVARCRRKKNTALHSSCMA